MHDHRAGTDLTARTDSDGHEVAQDEALADGALDVRTGLRTRSERCPGSSSSAS